MQFPALSDTIVAVSSAWNPAPLGIVRLSGPEAFALVGRWGVEPRPGRLPACSDVRLAIEPEVALPATILWFAGPRSYTGQDVVELHTVGCLPLLRALCERLIEWGARPALPGEFTGRAVLNGRLAARQAAGVLALMRATHEAEARDGLRCARQSHTAGLALVVDQLTSVLARLEAGIDFVDEEDIRFITRDELRSALGEIGRTLSSLANSPLDPRAGRPHVALLGQPNAGKSTLFNALVGSERALVSPVLGTTRDVISAEVDLEGIRCVLQDTAGLNDSSIELDEASRDAAERAARQADVVIWVHPVDEPWAERDASVVARFPPEQLLIVRSKCDLPPRGPQPDGLCVSAVTGAGLELVRSAVAELLRGRAARGGSSHAGVETAAEAISNAMEIVCDLDHELPVELISLELRRGRAALEDPGAVAADEEILDKIFSQFCVGK